MARALSWSNLRALFRTTTLLNDSSKLLPLSQQSLARELHLPDVPRYELKRLFHAQVAEVSTEVRSASDRHEVSADSSHHGLPEKSSDAVHPDSQHGSRKWESTIGHGDAEAGTVYETIAQRRERRSREAPLFIERYIRESKGKFPKANRLLKEFGGTWEFWREFLEQYKVDQYSSSQPNTLRADQASENATAVAGAGRDVVQSDRILRQTEGQSSVVAEAVNPTSTSNLNGGRLARAIGKGDAEIEALDFPPGHVSDHFPPIPDGANMDKDKSRLSARTARPQGREEFQGSDFVDLGVAETPLAGQEQTDQGGEKVSRLDHNVSSRGQGDISSLQGDISSLHGVYLQNLPLTLSEEDLASMFADCGNLVASKICNTGPKSRGFGFIYFQAVEDAERAILKVRENKLFPDRQIFAEKANTSLKSTKRVYVPPQSKVKFSWQEEARPAGQSRIDWERPALAGTGRNGPPLEGNRVSQSPGWLEMLDERGMLAYWVCIEKLPLDGETEALAELSTCGEIVATRCKERHGYQTLNVGYKTEGERNRAVALRNLWVAHGTIPVVVKGVRDVPLVGIRLSRMPPETTEYEYRTVCSSLGPIEKCQRRGPSVVDVLYNRLAPQEALTRLSRAEIGWSVQLIPKLPKAEVDRMANMPRFHEFASKAWDKRIADLEMLMDLMRIEFADLKDLKGAIDNKQDNANAQ